MSYKASTLLIGLGGIGTISALNLELGGKAAVTAVLRSNYEAVKKNGFNINSIDHGIVKGFKPTTILKSIPDVEKENLTPFKYVVCTTKNIPDVPPSLVDVIRPSVTPGHSVIVLIQNGLNIEKPFHKSFPQNVVLSAVSFCGSHQMSPGEIVQDDNDRISVGAFRNPSLDPSLEDQEAKDFCSLYAAGGKCVANYDPDVGFARWRKLLYNACLNSICAVTDLDTGRMRLADDAIQTMIRPAMEEIRAAAKACGVDLPVGLIDTMIENDPLQMYCLPSMQVDVRKGRFCEVENLVGEPVREGTSRGVSMPILTVFYNILKSIQWRTKERKGLVEIPPPENLMGDNE